MAPRDRLTLGPLQHPVRGLLHGTAALASLALAAWLWRASTCSPDVRAAILAFACSSFALYTASTLYHTVPWSPRWKKRMQRFDHSMIYVKIAGTMTPIVWIGLDDWRGVALLSAAWGIGGAGILQKTVFAELPERASIPLQAFQASLAVPAFAPFAERLPGAPVVLLGCAAGLYVLGAVLFLTERPRMWPPVFSFHELFHVCVVAGGSANAAIVVQYLARMH